MRWSKLKSLVEAKVARSIAPRFAIYSTAYGNCSCGHAWITLDKTVIANFCTRAFWNTNPTFDKSKNKFVSGEVPLDIPQSVVYSYAKQEVNYGELSRQDAYQACWEFVHDLSIEQALQSDDPLIQSLAVLDARIGKKRLMSLSAEKMHPLAHRLWKERLAAEDMLPDVAVEPDAPKAARLSI
jgi:hypothetical protein